MKSKSKVINYRNVYKISQVNNVYTKIITCKADIFPSFIDFYINHYRG